MLPKERRLTRKKDFDRVYREGSSFFVKEVGLKAAKSGIGLSRFGFVVSLKVSKKAVERNRIKRRLRSIVRERLPDIKSGFDCIFIARPGIKLLGYSDMEGKLLFLLGKAGIIGDAKIWEKN